MDITRPPNTSTVDEAVELALRSWKGASTELLEKYPEELVKNLEFELEDVSYQHKKQGTKNFESMCEVLKRHLTMAEKFYKYFEDVIANADSDLETDDLKVVFYVDERDPYHYREGLFKTGSLRNWISSQEGMRSVITSLPNLEDYVPKKTALSRLADISFASETKLEVGQQYFLLLALLLETHLDQKHPQWREISADETDKTSNGYYLTGRIRPSLIAEGLDKMLQESLISSGASAKDSLKNRIEPVLTYLNSPSIEIPNVKHQQNRFILKAIYLVAHKILQHKGSNGEQSNRLLVYPPGGQDQLSKLVTGPLPINENRANAILTEAHNETLKLQKHNP